MTAEYFTRTDGTKIAVRRVAGLEPAILFLPGHLSDMMGGKAVAIAEWAARNRRACIRFDYGGCGESSGAASEQTLDDWLSDVLLVLDSMHQPAILVGSSMGGWLMCLAALARPEKVKALLGIAPAPDFTEWGYDEDQKAAIMRDGAVEVPNDYGYGPVTITRAFWESGQANRILDRPIAIDCPVRLIHGQADEDVPWRTSLMLAKWLRSADVQVQLIKDGDHRLSRGQDISLILATLQRLMETL